MEYLCFYKKRWFISYIIILIILTFIMTMLNIPNSVKSSITSIYFIVHVLVVMFYKTTECKEFEIKEQQRLAKQLLNIN